MLFIYPRKDFYKEKQNYFRQAVYSPQNPFNVAIGTGI
jgi:hypothetical protein